MRTVPSTPAAALLILLGAASSSAYAAYAQPGSRCDESLSSRIPERSPAAPDGTEFVRRVTGISDEERESAILGQLLAGNVPSFLRRLAAVTVSGRLPGGRLASATVCVAPDYLAIGSDRNYLFVPMRLRTALVVAGNYRFALPTRKIVDAIYAQAPVHLQPQPLPAGDTMRTTAYYWQHNELVVAQRSAVSEPLGALTAGDKKDLVLTNRLWSNLARVAIYGWHRADGNPIQPLSTVHGARYADYSHGVRLVSTTAFVDGEPRSLMEVLQDPKLAALLSDEGAVRHATELVDVLSSHVVPALETAALRAQ